MAQSLNSGCATRKCIAGLRYLLNDDVETLNRLARTRCVVVKVKLAAAHMKRPALHLKREESQRLLLKCVVLYWAQAAPGAPRRAYSRTAAATFKASAAACSRRGGRAEAGDSSGQRRERGRC